MLLLLLLSPALLCAQPDDQWTRTYGGTNDDGGSVVRQLPDGGYFFAGYTYSFGAGNSDFWVVRTTATGDSLWSRMYGAGQADLLEDFRVMSDGGFVMVGWSDAFGAGERVVRANAQGDTLWTQVFPNSDAGYGNFVTETIDGGVIYAGCTPLGAAGTRRNLQLCRMDAGGAVLWTSVISGPLNDSPLNIRQNADSTFTLLSQMETDEYGGWELWVLRADSAGDSLSCTRHAIVPAFQCHRARFAADGNIILSGLHMQPDHLTYDRWLMKTDSAGTMLWSQLYWAETSNRTVISAAPLNDGGFLMAGSSTFLRTDSAGMVLWQRDAEPVADCEINDIEATADGECILGGCYYRHPGNTVDAWLLKTGPRLSAEDRGSILHPSAFSLSSSPNPFNPQTRLSFVLPQAGWTTLEVYDLLGRRAAILSRGFWAAGEHSILFDGSDLAAGTYIARLSTPHRQNAVKLLLVK
ncbi:MAG TPA: T9SS type A sorting domain-containing protein [bacterium]